MARLSEVLLAYTKATARKENPGATAVAEIYDTEEDLHLVIYVVPDDPDTMQEEFALEDRSYRTVAAAENDFSNLGFVDWRGDGLESAVSRLSVRRNRSVLWLSEEEFAEIYRRARQRERMVLLGDSVVREQARRNANQRKQKVVEPSAPPLSSPVISQLRLL